MDIAVPLELLEALHPDLLVALVGLDLVPEAVDLELAPDDCGFIVLEVFEVDQALMVAGLLLDLLFRGILGG